MRTLLLGVRYCIVVNIVLDIAIADVRKQCEGTLSCGLSGCLFGNLVGDPVPKCFFWVTVLSPLQIGNNYHHTTGETGMIQNITTTRKKRGGDCLTVEEARAAFGRLVRPDARALFCFLLATGLRISEALIVETADLQRGYTVLIGKGNRERTVYYGPELIEELQPYLQSRKEQPGKADRRLFPFSRRTAHRLLSAVGVYPHMLRHTCLTLLYRETRDIRLTQVVAGHADIRNTTRYTHHTQEEIRAAMTAPRRW